MRNYRILIVRRGALPSAPLNALSPGQPRGGLLSEEFAHDDAATLAACAAHIKTGCTVTVNTPSGEEWGHEQVVAKLKAERTL